LLTNVATGVIYGVEVMADDDSLPVKAVGSTNFDIPYGGYLISLVEDGELCSSVSRKVSLGFLKCACVVSVASDAEGITITDISYRKSLLAELFVGVATISCLFMIVICFFMRHSDTFRLSVDFLSHRGDQRRNILKDWQVMLSCENREERRLERKTLYKDILCRIRDFVVLFYDFSVIFLPVVVLYLLYKSQGGDYIAILFASLYLVPYAIHAGVFGSKVQKLAEYIMGYDSNSVLGLKEHEVKNVEYDSSQTVDAEAFRSGEKSTEILLSNLLKIVNDREIVGMVEKEVQNFRTAKESEDLSVPHEEDDTGI